MGPPAGAPRGTAGACRRYPPQMLVMQTGRTVEPEAEWPRVPHFQWCGEHQAEARNG
ncbi:hypothetical protein [Synechococcus phage MinM1]|nr:hypothetical protein [Synechococcus phage MinM1]